MVMETVDTSDMTIAMLLLAAVDARARGKAAQIVASGFGEPTRGFYVSTAESWERMAAQFDALARERTPTQRDYDDDEPLF